jgi:hypothetical protein
MMKLISVNPSGILGGNNPFRRMPVRARGRSKHRRISRDGSLPIGGDPSTNDRGVKQ